MQYLELLVLAIAPAVFLLVYLYFRDRYEREPLGLVVRTFFVGALMALPVVAVNYLILQPLAVALGVAAGAGKAPWEAFVTAALTEEFFKLAAVLLVAYRNPNFNEPFDGIVYTAAASLGFAALENVLYVLQGGLTTGLVRAVLSVPGHGVFGIIMGYYVGRAKFADGHLRKVTLFLGALGLPVLLHGLFNLLNLIEYEVAFYLLFPLFAFMWNRALYSIRTADGHSPFAPREARPAWRGTCPRCGTALVAEANFCHQCGLPTSRGQAVDSAG